MDLSFNDLSELEEKYSSMKSKGFNLDLTRGKPSESQLDLSNELDGILLNSFVLENTDIRNYGNIKGLTGCRELGAKILNYPSGNVLAGGNSSLTLMSQYLMSLFLHGSGKGPCLRACPRV